MQITETSSEELRREYKIVIAADDIEGARAAFNAVFRPVAVLIVILTGLAVAAAEVIVEVLFGSGGRLDADQLVEVTRLTRLVLPAQVFFVLGGLFMAVQYAHGRFLIPVLAPIIYNAGIVAGGLVGTGSGEVSATGFILGALGGALAGNLALQWWGARRTGLRLTPGRLDFGHPEFRAYLLLAVPLMIGQSIVVLDESIGKLVAAAGPEGSIFSLNLARRVNMVPVGVIAQAAGVAAYPYLARLVAEGRRAEMLASMGRTARMVVYAGGAAVAGAIGSASRPSGLPSSTASSLDASSAATNNASSSSKRPASRASSRTGTAPPYSTWRMPVSSTISQ